MIRQRERRGFTLILMTFMLTILIGAAAFAVDFSRMSLYRTQLRAAADAAAIAGEFSLAKGLGVAARDTAIVYDTLHLVGGSRGTLVATDVVPGTWTRAGGFVADAGANPWTNASNTALKVTTRFTGTYGFAKLFGMTTRSLSMTAVAARGSLSSGLCTRPWALPYQSLLDQLNSVYGGGPFDATTYNLSATDVTHLSQLTYANNIALKVGDNSSIVNGNFYAADLPPVVYANGTLGNPWNGANQYGSAIGESCAALATDMAARTTDPYVSVGDWLSSENGNMKQKTKDGLQALCSLSGSNYLCASPGVRITAAIWDTFGNAPGASGCGGKCFHIKYMGVFYVTGYNTATDAITGYFSATTGAGGGFSTSPGPIQTIALVQ